METRHLLVHGKEESDDDGQNMPCQANGGSDAGRNRCDQEEMNDMKQQGQRRQMVMMVVVVMKS